MRILSLLFLLASIQAVAQIPGTLSTELNTLTDQAIAGKATKGLSANVYYHAGEASMDMCRGVSYDNVEIESEMYFSIGSTSKLFSATALLRLQENDEVDLDDSIGTYLTALPSTIPGTITIRQLLQHKSGLADYINAAAIDSMNADYNRFWSPAELLAFAGQPTGNAGGTWKYCNTNYLLAGMIIEAITGENFTDAIRSLVFVPAGISSVNMMGLEPETGTIAHAWDHGVITPVTGDITSLPRTSLGCFSWAAGGYLARPSDLSKFYKALLVDSVLLNDASLTELLSTVGTVYPLPMNKYGLAVFVLNSTALDAAFHSGSWLHLSAVGVDLDYGNVATVAINDTEGLSTSVNVTNLMINLLKKMRVATLTAGMNDLAHEKSLFHPQGNGIYKCETVLKKVQVFDITGKLIFTVNNSNTIDVSHMSEGIFLIHSEAGTQRIFH